MMVIEGGLSSRMQVMESLDVFTDAYNDLYEGVLRACEELETYYETMNNKWETLVLFRTNWKQSMRIPPKYM